jgi:hypothetical protein
MNVGFADPTSIPLPYFFEVRTVRILPGRRI